MLDSIRIAARDYAVSVRDAKSSLGLRLSPGCLLVEPSEELGTVDAVSEVFGAYEFREQVTGTLRRAYQWPLFSVLVVEHGAAVPA